MTLRFKFTPSLLTITTGLLAVSLEANYGMSVPAKDLAKQVGGGGTNIESKSTFKSSHSIDAQASSYQGKASRLLSGSVAYGTQYWSYAKVDWMEPIWQSRGKQLYTSLDYMNHLHKSNNFSHEIGSGLVLWQSLASGTELGLGAYWLNYNSWHNLRHHGLRLGAKFIWQDWHLTGNGFFRMSNAKKAKVGVNYHLYYRQVGKMVAGEQMVNGVDMIVGRSLWGMDINGTAYYYPNTGNNLQLLTKGVGVKVAIPLKNPIQKFTAAYLSFIASNMYDKHHKTLTTFGIRLTNPSQRYVIQKTDTDGATTHYNCIIIQQVPPPADTLNPWSSHGVEKFTASDECQCISSALHQANTNTSKHYGWNYNGLTGSVKARQTLQSFNFC